MPTKLAIALKNALAGEDAARRYYELLADSTGDEEARTFLRRMAQQEARHFGQITEIVESLDDIELPKMPDDNVELIETMPEWSDVDEIDYASALVVALEAECHAQLVYDAIADALGPGEGRELFRSIAETEAQHEATLRQLMKP